MNHSIRTFRRLQLLILCVFLINLSGGAVTATPSTSPIESEVSFEDNTRMAPTYQYEDDPYGLGSGRLELPVATSDTFVTSVTSPYLTRDALDNGHSFSFEIAIDRYFPNLAYPDTQYYIGPNGFSDPLVHESMVANGILPEYAMLKLAVYDVDYPPDVPIGCAEITEVMVNFNWIEDYETGEVYTVEGQNNLWTLSEIRVPTKYLRLPEIPGANGNKPLPVQNTITIFVDADNCAEHFDANNPCPDPDSTSWGMAVDWAAINFGMVGLARPAIFVHGWTGDVDTLFAMDEFWLADNQISAGRPDMADGILPIRESGELLEAEIRRASREYNSPINIVGHSRGGLFAREVLRNPENESLVETVVTISTPHSGSSLPTSLIPIRCSQYGSSLSDFSACAKSAGSMDAYEMHYYNFADCIYEFQFTQIQTCTPRFEDELRHATHYALRGETWRGDISPFAATQPWNNQSWVTAQDTWPVVPFAHGIFPHDHTSITTGRDVYECTAALLGLKKYTVAEACDGFTAGPGDTTDPSASSNASISAADQLVASDMALTTSTSAESPGVGVDGLPTIATDVVALTANVSQAVPVTLAAEPAVVFSLFSASELAFSLTEPGGRQITPTVATSDPSVTYTVTPNLFVEEIWLHQYRIDAPLAGTWQRTIVADADLDGVLMVQSESALELRGGSTEFDQAINTVARIEAALVDGTVTQQNATMTAVITLPDSIVHTVTLVDTGANGDTTAGDGIYTGLLNVGATPGQAIGSISASVGNRTRTIDTIFNVVEPTASIQGVTAERAIAAADGFYERLELDVAFTTQVAGHFELTGSLVDATGAFIGQASFNSRRQASALTAGAHSITLSFEGERIRQKGLAGPYTLAYVAIRDDAQDGHVVAQQRDSYTTAAYQPRQFAGPLWKATTITEQPVDTNSDGRFDRLDIQLTLDTLFDNERYFWSATLFAPNGVTVGSLETTYQLAPNGTTLTLSFDGATIRRVAADGPYRLHLHVRTNDQNPNTPYDRSVTITHDTAAYDVYTFGNAEQCDPYEHNNTLKTARPIALNAAQTHAACSVNDDDWIAFDGEAGRMYRVTLSNKPAGSTFTLRAFDVLERSIAPVVSDVQSLVTYPLPAAGRYYIHIDPTTVPSPGSTATYTLQVEPIACASDVYEPNSLYDQATNLPLNSVQTHRLCTRDDEDWFNLDLVQGTAYRIETLNLSALVDTTIAIYPFGGTTPLGLDDNGGVNGGSRLDFTAPTTGRYQMRVKPSFASTFGDTATYDVRIIPSPLNPPPSTLPASPVNPGSLVANPVADAYFTVSGVRTDTTIPFVRTDGFTTTLAVQGVGDVYSLLRFNVSALPYAVASARLRLYAIEGDGEEVRVHTATGGNWQEDQFTGSYFGFPPITAPGLLISAVEEVHSGTWVEFDVTDLVHRTGVYNFALQSRSIDELLFSSREGNFPPQLVLTLAEPAGTDPMPTATPVISPTATNTPVVTNTPTVTPIPTATATNTSSPTQTPIGGGPKTALLVGSSSNTGDQAVISRLESLGYTVTVISASAVTAADATGKSVVLISASASASAVGTKLRDVTVPLINWHEALYDDLGMSSIAGSYVTNLTQVAITNPSHPLAAGLNGTTTVLTSSAWMTYGNPAGDAIVVATVPGNSTQAMIFAYEQGSTMAGMAAPARRIGFFFRGTAPTVANANGWNLFDAALTWAAGGTVSVSPTPTPTSTATPISSPTATNTPLATNTPSATPISGTSTVRVNGGGGAQTVSGTTWQACSSSGNCSGMVSGGFAYSSSNTVTGIPAGMNNAIFQSEWAGSASVGATAFTFSIPVTNGAYEVRLHFAELTKSATNQRTFDVQLEGTTVLSNYDIFAEVGQNVATMEAFPITISDGVVSLAFIKRIENPKISAIEIVPVEAPTNTPTATPVQSPTGTNTPMPTNTPTATPVAGTSTVRVNGGGGAQTVSGTTWQACSSTGNCSGMVSGGFPFNTSNTITGIPAGMNNAIFQSEWAGSASVGATAFTFNLPVTNGAYEVRLHFAELTKNAVNQRTFDVQLEGTTVLSNYDIFAEVGQNVATMEAFPVTITDGVVSLAFIKRIENPKISAIEIVPAEEAGLQSDNGQLHMVEQRMQARPSDYRIYLAFLTSAPAASSQDNADLSNAAGMTNAAFESVGAGASFSCGLTTTDAIVC